MEDLLVLASPDRLWKMLRLPLSSCSFSPSGDSLAFSISTKLGTFYQLNALSWLAMADASTHNIQIKVLSIRHDKVVEFKGNFKWKLLCNNIAGFSVLVLRRNLIQVSWEWYSLNCNYIIDNFDFPQIHHNTASQERSSLMPVPSSWSDLILELVRAARKLQTAGGSEICWWLLPRYIYLHYHILFSQ